jgi:hypothetical protein
MRSLRTGPQIVGSAAEMEAAGISRWVGPQLRSVNQACFVAGTPLLTPGGAKPIEQFRAGDEILSRSEFDPDGPLAVKIVEQTFFLQAKVLSVKVKDRQIHTTATHPFFVHGKGWVTAGHLRVGDKLSSHDGQWVTVEAVTDLNEVATVYNLRVSDYHTYFVGSREWGFSVWTHNTCYEIRRLASGQFGLYERATGNAVAVNGSHIVGANAAAVRRTGLLVPEIRAAGITEGVVGEYTTTITWGIQSDVPVRQSGPGYFGRRTPQPSAAVNAYELQINLSNESFYLRNAEGSYVQFENLIGNTLQDAKYIGNPARSWYRPSTLQPSLRRPAEAGILAEADRQLAVANLHNLHVEWVVSDQATVTELTNFFAANNRNIRVRFLLPQ